MNILQMSDRFHIRITSWASFLIPALVLWLRSGYAWGVALLVVGSMLSIPRWWGKDKSTPGTWWLVFAFLLMATVWLHGSDWSKGIGVLNKPSRYLVALPCLFYLVHYPPQLNYLFNGIQFGAASGGVRALHDVLILKVPRAWTTADSTANVIQLGNICGLMGLLCLLQLLIYWDRWSWSRRMVALACAALGVLGSLLSQTRGGWLGLAFCLPILLFVIGRYFSLRRAVVSAFLLIGMVAAIGWTTGDIVHDRVEEAASNLSMYAHSDNNKTSVGQRLFMWNMAWSLGLKKPMLGLGEVEFMREKARYVVANNGSKRVLKYRDVHNEILDQFVKRGFFGVFGMLTIYIIPMYLFWSKWRINKIGQEGDLTELILLYVTGLAVPLSFIGFGLTQTFFAHYNGIFMYLFLVMIIFSMLVNLAGEIEY